jgi:hypothetical protein
MSGSYRASTLRPFLAQTESRSWTIFSVEAGKILKPFGQNRYRSSRTRRTQLHSAPLAHEHWTDVAPRHPDRPLVILTALTVIPSTPTVIPSLSRNLPERSGGVVLLPPLELGTGRGAGFTTCPLTTNP